MVGIWSTYVIAFGGNMPSDAGSPAPTIIKSLSFLKVNGCLIRAVSRFFETPVYPAGAGPDYVNAVALVDSNLPPSAFLDLCHNVEQRLGRTRDLRWGQRTIDIDVIACDDAVVPTGAEQTRWRMLTPQQQATLVPDDLILPHPRLQDRAFVLVPMCDIAPDWCHPLLKRSARQMMQALAEDQFAGIRAL